ncbi:MAG: succinyl-CoA synthetase subunit beta [Rhodospirillales bacterium]|nr:succinyl-CoA synthetase subunit beta [Rhodospirillales bacterium]
MDLHEFQAKELLVRYGIRVPRGHLADTAVAAEAAAQEIGARRFAVKAQILAGDRGKHGGVRFASTPALVASEAGSLLGKQLATTQSPLRGLSVRWVYIEEAVDTAQLLYAAAAVDRRTGRCVLLASECGGDDLEKRAAGDPGVIKQIPLTLSTRTADGDLVGLARRIGLDGQQVMVAERFFRQLVTAFVALDATLLEINPIALIDGPEFVALDAKLTIDDNALFRHADLRGLRDFTVRDEGDPVELEAQHHQINYIRMGGDIGVVVNGAGLALATLDMLCDAGGRPANFMDIRTTASSLDIARGVQLLLENPAVRAILVNVHGGGMQACDTIAEGIGIAVHRSPARALPIVICMAGNHAEFAKTTLINTGVQHIACTSTWDAVQRVVGSVKKESRTWLSSLVQKRA